MLLPRTLTGLLAAGALLTLPASPPALAVGGITSDNAKPYYSTGHNFEDHEDLRVKVLGGHVRINRRWNGKRWEWNRRWDGLRISTGETLAEYNTRTEKERAARKTNSDEGRDTSGIVGLDPVYNDLYWLSRNNMRLISSIDANQGKTTYRYDNRDNLLQVEDPQGRQTRYHYDKNNRLQTEIKQTGTGTTQRRYHYDANGNRSRIINPGEEKTEHHYDAANRLIRTTLYSHKATAHPVKVIDYHYNNHDQYSGYSQTPGSDSDSDNATADIQRLSETRRYNNLNQLTSVSINTGHFEKTTRYSYRPNGLKNSYTSPEGKTYRYIYNKNNRLIAVIIPGKGTLSYINHRWLAPQTIKYPGGSQQNITIDDLQRPTGMIFKDPAKNQLGNARYHYDNESNLTRITTE